MKLRPCFSYRISKSVLLSANFDKILQSSSLFLYYLNSWHSDLENPQIWTPGGLDSSGRPINQAAIIQYLGSR